MKIALVAQHSTPVPAANDTGTAAGDDAQLVEMSRSLAGQGHQVTVYARRNGAGLPERAGLAPGVSVEYVGPAEAGGGDSRLAAQVGAFSAPLREQWAKDRPDVVHALRWTSGLAALAAARDLRVPVVQTFDQLGVTERRHGLSGPGAGTERSRLEPAIGRTVDAVVASDYDEETDLTRLGIPPRPLRAGAPAAAAWSPSPTSLPSRTPSPSCSRRWPRSPAPSSSWPAAPTARTCAATCPTAAWSGWGSPSPCTGGSSSPGRSPGPPCRRCCARPT